MTELRRINETNPSLAAEIVQGNREAARLMDGSFRLGLIVSCILAVAALGGAAYIVVNLGWWQTVAFVLAMLGVSHLIRVILTGEWSDTNWLGKFLGGKPKDKE